MPAGARRAAKGANYIAAAKPATESTVETVEQAIRLVRWLGSPAAELDTHRQRKARAEAVADWLADYAQRIERVEFGCQRLLLQAAEMCGEVTPSDPRTPSRPAGPSRTNRPVPA